MRRAIPYPCIGPMLWRVCSTMKSRVPCNASIFPEALVCPLATAKVYYADPWDVNRCAAICQRESIRSSGSRVVPKRPSDRLAPDVRTDRHHSEPLVELDVEIRNSGF